MNMFTHKLSSGATVVSLSPHEFRFSDGTVAPPQNKEFCDKFTLKKEFRVLREIKGMKVTTTKFVVSQQQFDNLKDISNQVDIILVPFQFLQALNDSFSEKINNVVAFNSTPETARSAPNEKIVDINNWSAIN